VNGATTALLLAAALIACGKEATKESPRAATPTRTPAAAERYFPLEEGKIYNYVTKDGGETGMLVAKVHRADDKRGELRLSNATKRFTYAADGVTYEGGAYILRAPFDVGSSWPGEHGGTTTIASTDASVDVPAGRYGACLQTVETGGQTAGKRYETTYCPGIGMVLLIVTAGGSEARAELKSYGMPIKIE
jgi:hypothetical protein